MDCERHHKRRGEGEGMTLEDGERRARTGTRRQA